MPLDPNIFFQGAALRQANDARTQQLIGGLFDKLEARRMAEQDPEKQLRQAVFRISSGKGTPEDEQLIKAESLLRGSKTQYQPDAFGNVRAVSEPTLYDRLYGAGTQAVSPQAMGMPASDISLPVPVGAAPPKSVMDAIPRLDVSMLGDNFQGGEPGIDLQRIADAKVNNAVAVNKPAPQFISPAEKQAIDAMGYGQKARYEADMDLQKKKAESDIALQQKQAEKQLDIQSKANEPLSLEQGKVATFADRMQEANKIIGDLTLSQTSLKQKALSASPILPNYLTDENYKKASQAQRNFINAVLRRESGAVISPEEFANAREQYFPQPGDTPEVIAQKAQNRKTVIEGFSREAGPAYKPKADTSQSVINWEDLP